MPRYLDTRGRTTLGIGICARCSEKFSLDDLFQDPNSPGLYVCKGDLDDLDPYRLPAREADRLTLDHPRPDVNLSPGPMPIWTNQMEAVLATDGGIAIEAGGGAAIAIAPPVTATTPSTPWTANTAYGLGAQVTAGNPVGFAAAGTQIYVFTCIIPGQSGPAPPVWPSKTGVDVVDGQVMWLCTGLYLP